MGGGGLDGILSALLDGEEPSRFSIRAASAWGFIEIQAHPSRYFRPERESNTHSLGPLIVDAADRALHGLSDPMLCQINLCRIQAQRGCHL